MVQMFKGQKAIQEIYNSANYVSYSLIQQKLIMTTYVPTTWCVWVTCPIFVMQVWSYYRASDPDCG